MKSGRKSRTLDSDSGKVDAIFMGPSNLLAVVDSLRGRIDLWSTTNWKQAEVFKFVQVEGVLFNECLSASSNGSLLAFPVGNDAHQTGSIDAGFSVDYQASRCFDPVEFLPIPRAPVRWVV
jgi:hypothetical protein